ncbi:unnamed protein product [Linum trigynum]
MESTEEVLARSEDSLSPPSSDRLGHALSRVFLVMDSAEEGSDMKTQLSFYFSGGDGHGGGRRRGRQTTMEKVGDEGGI